MPQLTPSCLTLSKQPHVAVDRLSNLIVLRENQLALLEEAEDLPDALAVWQPESDALVRSIMNAIQRTDAKIDQALTLAPLVNAAVDALAVTSAALRAANMAHTGIAGAPIGHPVGGSVDRSEALRLRDDAEHATQVHRIRNLELHELATRALALGTNTTHVQRGPSTIARGLADFVTLRKFKPERSTGVIDSTVMTRWFGAPETETMWIPFHAAHVLKEAAADTRVDSHDVTHPKLPVREYLAELASFRSQRETFLRSAAARAWQHAVDAEAAVAALPGGAS